LNPTNKLVQDLLKSESCYINTAHPDFLSGHKAMSIVTERLTMGKVQAMEKEFQKANVRGQQVASLTNQLNTQQGPQTPQSAAQNQLQNQIISTTVSTISYEASQSNSSYSDGNTGFFSSFFAGGKKKPTKQLQPKLEQPPTTLKATGQLSEREKLETEVIKLLLDSYFNIVKRTICDMVPKAIMLNLVSYTKENMQRELLSALYKSQSLKDALKESDYIVNRRNECKKMIEVLAQAETHVSNV